MSVAVIRASSVKSALIRAKAILRATSFLGGSALILAVPTQVSAQNGAAPQATPVRVDASARIASAPVVSQRPVIDGRLDDPVWRDAPVLAGFVQRELHEGQPVSERTEVRIVTDGEAIYVGAWMYDREPHAIVPGEKIRDGSLDNSDYFAIIFDTFLDRQHGLVFASTPAEVEHACQVMTEGAR